MPWEIVQGELPAMFYLENVDLKSSRIILLHIIDTGKKNLIFAGSRLNKRTWKGSVQLHTIQNG
jgi:hypothetical protein